MGTHYVTLSVASMRVSNPDSSRLGINSLVSQKSATLLLRRVCHSLRQPGANLPAQSSRDLVTTPIFGSLFCGETPVSGGGL
jgi:hypothetical protein